MLTFTSDFLNGQDHDVPRIGLVNVLLSKN